MLGEPVPHLGEALLDMGGQFVEVGGLGARSDEIPGLFDGHRRCVDSVLDVVVHGGGEACGRRAREQPTTSTSSPSSTSLALTYPATAEGRLRSQGTQSSSPRLRGLQERIAPGSSADSILRAMDVDTEVGTAQQDALGG